MGYPADDENAKSEGKEIDQQNHDNETQKKDGEDMTNSISNRLGESTENKGTNDDVNGDGDRAVSSPENATNNGKNETENSKSINDAQCTKVTEEVSNATSIEKNKDDQNGDQASVPSARSESRVDIESQDEMTGTPSSSTPISEKPDDTAMTTDNFITNEGVERPERPSRTLKHDLGSNDGSFSDDLDCDQPDASVLEFFVNASKNAPFRTNSAGSSIEEIEITSDDEDPTSPFTKSKRNERRKRKHDFFGSNSSSKKPKAVQVIDLELDSKEATLSGPSFRKMSVSNDDSRMISVKSNKKSTPSSSVSATIRPSSSSTFVTETVTGTICPLPNVTSSVIASPTRDSTASSDMGTPQPLGNTGTNFVIIRPPTTDATADDNNPLRPLTAIDIATMIMPTADWNVNSYRQGFSISETILSSRLIEIICRSITISSTSSRMNFSVYGQLVPQFASCVVASSVAEVQSILNRFANVPICPGIGIEEASLGDSAPKLLYAQSNLYRHVDDYYRSTDCPLVLTDSANPAFDFKTFMDSKPQNNGMKLCNHCSSAKTALRSITT